MIIYDEAKHGKALTVDQAAEYLGTTPGTLGQWRYEETGPAFYKQHGRCWYPIAFLQEWLNQKRVLITGKQ